MTNVTAVRAPALTSRPEGAISSLSRLEARQVGSRARTGTVPGDGPIAGEIVDEGRRNGQSVATTRRPRGAHRCVGRTTRTMSFQR